MNKTGIIEGFFGPQWKHEARKGYASFLRDSGGGFYIYAPKQDAHLRKGWREEWEQEYLIYLSDLVSTFHNEGIEFGVGFSPFGLGRKLSDEDRTHLEKKLSILNDLGIDLLGLFFDDMPVSDDLAKTQIEALSVIRKSFSKKIIFCPSYYTPDPILDKVFGQRPHNYLLDIANGLPADVSVAWTGPKVISPEISREHLSETASLLKRKPFLWENFFANDGPKNCKFLKLKPFTGRDHAAFLEAEAFGFNMMNQPELSKILYLASIYVLQNGTDPLEAFKKSTLELCSEQMSEFIFINQEIFLSKGLDQINPDEKVNFLKQLKSFPDPAAREVEDWLEDKYSVGSECLTD